VTKENIEASIMLEIDKLENDFAPVDITVIEVRLAIRRE